MFIQSEISLLEVPLNLRVDAYRPLKHLVAMKIKEVTVSGEIEHPSILTLSQTAIHAANCHWEFCHFVDVYN